MIMEPQTTPIPVIRSETPIYDELIAELGDPFYKDQAIELAEAKFQAARDDYKQFIQDLYLEQIDLKYAEPQPEPEKPVEPDTDVIVALNPLRKHKR